MAFTVAVVVLKGGAAKTVTSLALGEAAATALDGGASDAEVTIVDADPMGGALRQSTLAEEAGRPFRATVVGIPSADLSRRIGSVASASELVVIDGPPPGALKIAQAAIESADVVVMPCPARLGDLDRVTATLALADKARVPVYGVLTFAQKGKKRTTISTMAAEVMLREDYGVNLLETFLPLTDQVSNNYGRRPRGPLARYGRELLDELTRKAADG